MGEKSPTERRMPMFYVQELLDHLAEIHYQPKTVRDYRYLLNRFVFYCSKQQVADITAITEAMVRDFLKSVSKGDLNRKSTYIKIRRLRKYFRFLEDRGYLFLPPDIEQPVHVPPSTCRLPPGGEEMDQVLSQIRTDTPLCLKGKAMLELAYSSALRPRELYNLKITDIDFKKGLLFLEQSKNRKDRIVPVGRHALYWVKRYLAEVRPHYIKGNSEESVFISHKTGRKLSVWGIRWAVQQTLRLSGFAPFKPYAVRASAAAALLGNGMSVAYIRKLLGHTELRTTQIYLNIQSQDLKQILEEHHPRNRLGKISKGERSK
jgi:integrase/recombinase XerD